MSDTSFPTPVFPATGIPPQVSQKAGGYFNLLIATDAPPISVITATGSVDQAGTYVFEVEAQVVAVTQTKQVPYWSTAQGNDTMINLWNPTPKDQDAILTFFYSGGQYKYLVHLPGNGSAMVSIKELQSMGAPDSGGNVLPKTVETGSAWLSATAGVNEDLNVIVSVGTFNVTTATCGTMWPTCLGQVNFWVSPDPFSLVNGGEFQVDSYAQSTSGGVTSATAKSSWSSSNTSIGRVVSAGLFYGAALGSFNGQAQANLISASQDCARGGPCATDYFQGVSQGNTVDCTPTGESSSFSQWGDNDPLAGYNASAAGFIQTLTPTYSIQGGTVSESDYSPAADTCYFNGSAYPPAAGVTGSTWNVGSDSRWGPDYVGYQYAAFAYYQSTRPAMGLPLPCGATLFQRLTYHCPTGQATVYLDTVLQTTISGTGISVSREGQTATRSLIGQ